MKKTGKLTAQDVNLIHEVANIIEKNIERDLTIRELARVVILTEKKLKIGFKEVFGMGVHAYLRNMRLEKVKVMLIENKPHKAIVRATGFKSQSGLSKTFKKVTGMTPTEWKNSQRMIGAAS